MSGLQRSQSLAIDLDVRPLAGRIGAQIDSIRLAGDLPDATIAAIEAALSKYKVIFFRDQGHLDDAEQERDHHHAAGDRIHPAPCGESVDRIAEAERGVDDDAVEEHVEAPAHHRQAEEELADAATGTACALHVHRLPH